MRTKKSRMFYMAGTEGTGEYQVLARTGRGKVGIRDLGNGRFRIRIEPFGERFVAKMAQHFSPTDGWKQPGEGGQFRFSIMTTDKCGDHVTAALEAIGHKRLVSKTNPALPEWATALLPA